MIEWSDEQRQLQAAVREFVQKEVVPRRDDLEHGDLAPYDVLRSYVRTFGIDELAAQMREGSLAVSAARRYAYDEVIDPAETRDRIVRMLELLPPPPARTAKKHYIDTW